MPHRNRKTPGKTTIKKMIRERDGYQCTQCKISNDECLERHGRSLDVHRLVPGSRYTLEGCVTLCAECHGPQPRRPRGHRPLDDLAFNDEILECIHWTAEHLGIPAHVLVRMVVAENIHIYMARARKIIDDHKAVWAKIIGTD